MLICLDVPGICEAGAGVGLVVLGVCVDVVTIGTGGVRTGRVGVRNCGVVEGSTREETRGEGEGLERMLGVLDVLCDAISLFALRKIFI